MSANKTTDKDVLIPESLKQAAKEIAAVCRKHKLRVCEAKLRPGAQDQFSDYLSFTWSLGRHGASSDFANLSYTRNIRVPVDNEIEEANE